MVEYGSLYGVYPMKFCWFGLLSCYVFVLWCWVSGLILSWHIC